jgi:hypothetical protein
MIGARHVGEVAAEIAASHGTKTYWLTGPERDTMIGAGVPEPVAEMNAQAFTMTADGDGSGCGSV